MNIYDVIRNETDNCRSKKAIVAGDHSISYKQLFSSVDQVANLLLKRGVCKYDRIALRCTDSIEYVVTALAILSISATVVPIAVEQAVVEVDEILDRIAVDYLVFEKGFYNITDSDKMEAIVFFERDLYVQNRRNKKKPDDEYFSINPAFIRFSSGTTGASKGVVLSHETIIERTSAADKGLQMTSDDIVLWVLSMSFHFVVTILLFMRRGTTIVLCSTPFPDSLIDGIIKHKGTFIYASPFHYNLISHIDSLTSLSLQNIRLAVSTAIKLPGNIEDAFKSRFGFELTEAYGIIEVGLPFINLTTNKHKRSSTGKVLPDYEVRIDNDDCNGTGQILIKGKGLLDAYFSPWQNRSDILRDGWFHTGDVGRIDEDGSLTIVGREKDIINFAGMKVFPYEVEAVLNSYPGVKESCVYGEDHPYYGQLPVAKVVLEKPDDESAVDELRRYCYERLSKYKVPKSFNIVSEMDKTLSGKIRRV